MCRQLEQMKKERQRTFSASSAASSSTVTAAKLYNRGSNGGMDCNRGGLQNCSSPDSEQENYECLAMHVCPDLGERIMLSGDRCLVEEVFPETNQALMDARSSIAWNQHDAAHVIRFPLNGYCKLNSVQAITRLLNAGFRIAASSGGGVEGQQFSEYLFVRKALSVT